MAAHHTLLAWTASLPRTLARLRQSLELCTTGLVQASATTAHNKQGRQHALRVQEALDGFLSSSSPPSVELLHDDVQPIRDEFFTDQGGNMVEGADYAYVQLAGPEGPLISNTVRFGLSYQGPGLSYLGHHHTAQELYVVMEGQSLWWTDSAPQWSEQTVSFHMTGENHAMRTQENSALFFWSWTGDLTMDVKLSANAVQDRLLSHPAR